MKKLKAIFRILCSDHFYLITANGGLQTEEIWESCAKDENYTISTMIFLYWNAFWKYTFASKPENEKYL